MKPRRYPLLVFLTGCGPTSIGVGTGTGDASGASTSIGSAAATSTSDPMPTTEAESSSTGVVFPPPMTCAELKNFPAEECDTDWAARTGAECNPWVDDCGPGAACRFGDANDGVRPTCQALPDLPKQMFAACSETSECDKGLYCNGWCNPHCTCNPLHPHCADPGQYCLQYGDIYAEPGPCVTVCDVLDPDCPIHQPTCLPYPPGPSCTDGDYPLQIGDPCEPDVVSCGSGSACTEGAPTCERGACCSPFCALDDLAACAEFGPEYACEELLGYEPLCYENVGVCRRSR